MFFNLLECMNIQIDSKDKMQIKETCLNQANQIKYKLALDLLNIEEERKVSPSRDVYSFTLSPKPPSSNYSNHSRISIASTVTRESNMLRRKLKKAFRKKL